MNKIKYLEGLRGIAALIVVFGHLKLTGFIEEYQEASDIYTYRGDLDLMRYIRVRFIDLFTDGTLSVWVFWILSSYVISIKFFKKNINYDKIVIGYFSKRYFRLLIPVLGSVLFAFALLKLGFMYNLELANTFGEDYQNWLGSFYSFSPSFYMALKSALFDSFFSYDSKTTYNAVLWTIKNEFIGSLFTFSIFGIVRHNKSRYLVYLIIIFITIKLNLIWLSAFVIGHVLCDFDYSGIDTKFSMSLRRLENKIHSYNVVVLLIFILFLFVGRDLMFQVEISEKFHDLILSTLIVYLSVRNKSLMKFFSMKVPFWLGNVSFALYLIHLPIICSLTSYVLLIDSSLEIKVVISISTILISLILSHYFTIYVDRFGIRFANKIGDYFIDRT